MNLEPVVKLQDGTRCPMPSASYFSRDNKCNKSLRLRGHCEPLMQIMDLNRSFTLSIFLLLLFPTI